MWLQVNEELKLEQVIKQLQKLPDVLSVERHEAGHAVFTGLAVYL
jgi:acetolactate synthase-1/3 small subunit